MNIKVRTFFLALFFLMIACEKNEVENIGNTLKPEYAEFLELINELRVNGCNCGDVTMDPVLPVKWNDTLALAALLHSRDMTTENFFSHTGSDNSNAGERIKRAGYNWKTYGENIAGGYSSTEDAFLAWLNSPGHCKNMMNGNFKEIGLGREDNYWTLDLGTRK